MPPTNSQLETLDLTSTQIMVSDSGEITGGIFIEDFFCARKNHEIPGTAEPDFARNCTKNSQNSEELFQVFKHG